MLQFLSFFLFFPYLFICFFNDVLASFLAMKLIFNIIMCLYRCISIWVTDVHVTEHICNYLMCFFSLLMFQHCTPSYLYSFIYLFFVISYIEQAIIDAASYVPPPPSEEQKKKIAKMYALHIWMSLFLKSVWS